MEQQNYVQINYLLQLIILKVIEISNFEELKLSESFSIKAIAADNCDPELCYKFNGCADVNIKGETQQIDSLSIINCNNQNILNIENLHEDDLPCRLNKNLNFQYDE